MKLWINWISVMLLGLMPLVIHLFMKKPRSQSLSYDLAGLIGDPPIDKPQESKKSFAKIQSIEDVELSVEDIRRCLKVSRDLSRPHAAKSARPIALDKTESEATKLSADNLIKSFSSSVSLAKEINSKETEIPKIQEVQAKQESDDDIRQSRSEAVQQSTANHNSNRRHSHVRNLDVVLDIQANRRPRGH